MGKLVVPTALLFVVLGVMANVDMDATVEVRGLAALAVIALPVAMCAFWRALCGGGFLFWVVVVVMVWAELTVLGVVDGDLLTLLGVA